MKKVLLAFSGGLDTSFCAMYLQKKRDMRFTQHLPTPEDLMKKS